MLTQILWFTTWNCIGCGTEQLYRSGFTFHVIEKVRDRYGYRTRYVLEWIRVLLQDGFILGWLWYCYETVLGWL